MTCTSPKLGVIDQLVHRACSLYTLPAVAAEVIRLTGQDDIDVQNLAKSIEQDPALTAKVLRTVNSSMFGLNQPVTNLNQAVSMLGIKTLKLLVLGFNLPPKMFEGVAADVLSTYWTRTLVKAVAARHIAALVDNIDEDEAFLAGLLQDIGMLVLVNHLGEPYTNFVTKVRMEADDLLELELETLGFDHRILSSRLLTKWGIPKSLANGVAANAKAEEKSLARVLQLAEAMAQLVIEERSEVLVALIAAGDQQKWWNADQLNKIVEQLQEDVFQLADVLDITLDGRADFTQILYCAHQQLAAEAENAVVDIANEHAANDAPWEQAEQLEKAVANLQPSSLPSPEDAVKAPPKKSEANSMKQPDVSSATAVIESAVAAALAVRPVDVDTASMRDRVRQAVAASRRLRQPLSMVIVEIDNFPQLVFHLGAKVATQYFDSTLQQAQSLANMPSTAFIVGEAKFAMLLQGCERATAVNLGRQLVERMQPTGQGGVAMNIRIGVATVELPAANFPADDLITAAERCLAGVQNSGGTGVKSISIY